ncbi:MAG: ribonuclease HII [Thermoplasmata archaeon]|nr:ribonuclease HII [Thermoplasmata archaeon]
MMGCGVDEAGRGPVIGPLVIVGVCADREKLIQLGVKDSKKLSKRRREALEKEIKKIAERVVVKIIEPEEIDRLRREITLNEIEVMGFAEVINELNCMVVYVDAADADASRFARNIQKYLQKEVKIISEHKADEIYPEVSAASIIAKVERDRRIEEIIREIGDFGSGYPSDPRTSKFLENYYKEHGEFPPHTRHSWKNARRIKAKAKQKSIEEF